MNSRKKCFENCYYGKKLEYVDHLNKNRTIRLCTVNKNLDVCTCPITCNAFISKINKDTLKKEFENELKDYNVKKNKYPELLELEWVLDKDLKEATNNPPLLGRFIVYIINLLEIILKYMYKERNVIDKSREL